MTSVWSISIRFPKPWQVGQAPRGLLNENSCGCGSSYGRAQPRAIEAIREAERGTIRQRDRGRAAALARTRPPAPPPGARSRSSSSFTRSTSTTHGSDELPRALGQRLDRRTASPSCSRRRKPRFWQGLEEVGARRPADRHREAHEQRTSAVRAPAQPLRRRLGRVARHLRSAGLADDAAGPREEDAQVVVHLGRGRDGGAGVARGRRAGGSRPPGTCRPPSRGPASRAARGTAGRDATGSRRSVAGPRRRACRRRGCSCRSRRRRSPPPGARSGSRRRSPSGCGRGCRARRSPRMEIGVSPRAALPPWRQSPIIPSGCLGPRNAPLLLLEGRGDLLLFLRSGACRRSSPPSPSRAFRASSASSTSLFLLMADSWRSRSSPSETAIVSMAESLSAWLWIDSAVLSKTFIAPSMLYSSVIACMRFWASFMALIDFSSPSCRILPFDALLFDLELGARVVGPDLGRLEGRLGTIARRPRLDLQLQRAAGQLLVARLHRLLGLALEVLETRVLGVQVALRLRLEGDGGGGRLPQRAQVVEHLAHGLLEHGDGDLRLRLAQDGVEDGREEASDAREHCEPPCPCGPARRSSVESGKIAPQARSDKEGAADGFVVVLRGRARPILARPAPIRSS